MISDLGKSFYKNKKGDKIIQKRSKILLGTIGILVLIMFLPSALGYSGTVVPRRIVNTYGDQEGELEDIQSDDDDFVEWEGVDAGWFQWKILTKIYFTVVTNVGDDNEIRIKFAFNGGNVIDILVKYTDSSYDIHVEISASWKTVIYDLVDDKIVDYVQFFNHEIGWWPGVLKVDYMAVTYT